MHIHGGDIYTYQGMLDFSANINPLGIPASVVKAAARGAEQAASYPDTQCRDLRRALAVQESIGLTQPVQPEEIICGNGAADLIFALTLAQKPRQALLPAPGFHEYEQALRAIGCHIQYHYLTAQNGFQLDVQRLTAEITPETELLFLCNPNNPTGLAISRQELQPLLKRCQQCQTLLVLDECFNEFLDDPAAYTLKPLLAANPNLFILKAFTKLYAMPGLRLGYGLCANSVLLNRLAEVSQPWRVSTPAQLAGLAALQEQAYVRQAQELIRHERQFLQQQLSALGMQVYNSMANYIFFKTPADWPATFNLAAACREQQILIRDCSNYVGLTPGFYRIAVRTRPENEQLLRAMQQIVLTQEQQGDKCNE